jgi:hypothetical protein
VRSDSDFGLSVPKPCTSFAHSSRAARSLATSMKKLIPMPKKKLSRGANSSMDSPASRPARRYSAPSASV